MSEALSPKQLLDEARADYQRGNYSGAARAFEAAADAYRLTGDELAASEALNNASVAHLQTGDKAASYRAVDGTAEVFAAAGDIRRQGMALGNLGAALESLDRLDEAMEAYKQSAEMLEQAGDNALRAHVMQSLSSVQLRTGHQLEALASMQAGLAGVDKPSPVQRALKKLLRVPFNLINRG